MSKCSVNLEMYGWDDILVGLLDGLRWSSGWVWDVGRAGGRA
jgi:hypothetical protein